MTYDMLMGTLNPTHSVTRHWTSKRSSEIAG